MNDALMMYFSVRFKGEPDHALVGRFQHLRVRGQRGVGAEGIRGREDGIAGIDYLI